MPPAPSAVPSPSDASHSLAQSEAEVAGRESRLATDSQSLMQGARLMATRLDALRRGATHESPSAEMKRLAAAVEQTALPVLDVGAQISAAHAARLQALQARRAAMDHAERALASYTVALQTLAQQVEAQEQALTQALARRQAELQARPPEPEAGPPGMAPAGSASGNVTELKQRRAPVGASVPPPAGTPSESVPTMARRGQSRVRMQAAVDLSSDSNFFTGFSTNLSEGGLFIATVKAPPRGTTVEVKFTLPNGNVVEVKGVVRWIREVNDQTPEIFPGVGVQFTELQPQALAAIKNFVSQREPMFYPE